MIENEPRNNSVTMGLISQTYHSTSTGMTFALIGRQIARQEGGIREAIHTCIYITYTSSLGSQIILPGVEREQGRFRGSIEGAKDANLLS